MNRSTKILLFISGIIILLLVIAVFVYPFLTTPEAEDIVLPPAVESPSTLTPLPPNNQDTTTNLPSAVEPFPGDTTQGTEANQRADIERITRLVLERFGSYSNFSNFQNIISIRSFLTDSMNNYAQSLINEQSSERTADYYGVTSRVLGVTINEFVSESRATATVILQEEVQDGLDADIVKRTRDARVNLVYRNGTWLVDGVFYN